MMLAYAITDWPAIVGTLGVLGGLAATAWLNSRAKTGEAWRETAEAYEKELQLTKDQVARLEQVDQERALEIVSMQAQLDHLKAQGDVAEQFLRHETNAQARADRTHELQEKTLNVLERVASAVEQTGGTP